MLYLTTFKKKKKTVNPGLKGVRYFPKDIFPNWQLSKFCNFLSGNFQKKRLGLLKRHRLQWGLSTATRMSQGVYRQARTCWGPSTAARTDWDFAAWEITHFGSYHLRKYPWKVATWEKSFGKVHNIDKKMHGFNVYSNKQGNFREQKQFQ